MNRKTLTKTILAGAMIIGGFSSTCNAHPDIKFKIDNQAYPPEHELNEIIATYPKGKELIVFASHKYEEGIVKGVKDLPKSNDFDYEALTQAKGVYIRAKGERILTLSKPCSFDKRGQTWPEDGSHTITFTIKQTHRQNWHPWCSIDIE